MQQFKLYKGLQRPLIFKAFKGKFIYWALGSIVAGIVIGGIVSSMVSSVIGILTMIGISIPLLFYTISRQKKGLYNKTADKVIYMIPSVYKPKQHAEKSI